MRFSPNQICHFHTRFSIQLPQVIEYLRGISFKTEDPGTYNRSAVKMTFISQSQDLLVQQVNA